MSLKWVSPLLVNSTRVQAVAALRSTIQAVSATVSSSPNTSSVPSSTTSTLKPTARPGSDILKNPSQSSKLLDYYPPDVDVYRLSLQDPALANLGLVDEWVKAKLERENALTKRGKIIRVGVLAGRRKKVEGETKAKRKKK
ncbi:hypothetical protein HDU76_012517 [Blyttiomyces sp. JEL0837]|nr:hypothetical protein HDU76_012517 [Blyttiomyces sp. JEL0837]